MMLDVRARVTSCLLGLRQTAAVLLFLAACTSVPAPTGPYVHVLGIAQDGGYPQAGCVRADCISAWKHPKHVASLAIVDPQSGQQWIIDATPDFAAQLAMLPRPRVDGILLTHAHIGHYLGLAQLGREVMGAKNVTVYAMPRMSEFLQKNGPWEQLVRLGNIRIEPMEREIVLNERIRVTALRVPHRDEYSETVGFIVRGSNRAILWLPDIDKWEKWETPLESVLETVDLAYLDGTFYTADELPGRNMSEIPHPFIIETMKRLRDSPLRQRVRFIHLNQSNPLLREKRPGIVIAREGEQEGL
jgi:pyrroloquinoline quinone biosynthesis protein B